MNNLIFRAYIAILMISIISQYSIFNTGEFGMQLLGRLSLLLISAFIVAFLAGCASQQKIIVADIEGEKITLDECESMYEKNHGGVDAAKKSSLEDRQKFLDLYVKFKLKVKEAYRRGYEKDPELRTELNEYRRNLSVSYLLNKELSEPEIQKMYQRKLEELRASHILLILKNATPADTAAQYVLAMKLIDSLRAGVPFETLAVRYSQDPSAANNYGDLYYFSAGAMVPEFEDAAYSLHAGEFTTRPVRTQFGYHILKLTERKPNPGSVRVSHIMKRLVRGVSPEDSAKAYADIRMILDSLKAGKSFSDLAAAYSDDKYSSDRGGDLGFVERRRTVLEFDDAAFKLKKGEISGIVKTQYGLHILQANDIQPVRSFQEMEQELKQFYQQYRFDTEYDKLVERLKKQNQFTIVDASLADLTKELDTSKTTSMPTWDSTITMQTRTKTLFAFGGQNVSVDSVIRLAKASQELQGLHLKNEGTLSTILNKTAKTVIVEYGARGMEIKYPEFAQIMKEYEEGVLLFKAEQTEVWNKVVVNDSIMRPYYQENRSKYTWPDRVNIQEIYVPNDSMVTLVNFLFKKQKISFDTIAATYNQRTSTKEKNGEWGLLPVTTNELTQKGWTMQVGDVSEFFHYENGFSMVKALEKDPARDKTMSEAGSELSSAFQEYESKRLESLWYNSLKARYPVVIIKEALDLAFTK
jgi:peptidyl-prolyl cis-trans isomerase SurA